MSGPHVVPNPTAPGMPQRMVVILLDSLNRHLIRPNVVNDPAENEDRVGTARRSAPPRNCWCTHSPWSRPPRTSSRASAFGEQTDGLQLSKGLPAPIPTTSETPALLPLRSNAPHEQFHRLVRPLG